MLCMEEKIIRMRVHPVLFKKYKIICAHYDLSMPKQTSALIREFVKVQEANLPFGRLKAKALDMPPSQIDLQSRIGPFREDLKDD